MTKEMYDLREMLVDELNKLTKKGELTAGSLDTVDKLTHSIKSIDTICAMEDAGNYSYGDMSYNSYNDNMSYARGRGSNARRDSMGRYASNDGSYKGYSRYSMNNSYDNRGYSNHNKQELVEELRELMNETTDSKSRMAIQNAIQQMEG